MCHGKGCTPTFTDAVCDSCTLIALAGASVTLKSPELKNMDVSDASDSVVAHGTGTHVTVDEGDIQGGRVR